MAPQSRMKRAGIKNAKMRKKAPDPKRPIQLKDLPSLKEEGPKFVFIQDAIDKKTALPKLRTLYPRKSWEESEAIFNSSDDTAETVKNKRLYKVLKRDDLTALEPFLEKLESVKDATHVITGLAMIRSVSGCPKQDPHTDYFTMRSHGKTKDCVLPYSGLVAVERGSSIYVQGQKIDLPCRSAVLIRGDVVHNGSGYKKDNIRVHFYLDVAGVHEASAGTHVHWSK